MPLATFSGLADTDEVIESELIGEYLASFEYGANLGAAVAWAQPGKGTIPVTFPRWDQISATPAVKAETVAFGDRDVAMSESTITPGFVGYRFPVSDEVEMNTNPGISASRLDQAMEGLLDFIERDVLSSSTSATSTAGTVTRTYSLAELRADKAAYAALHVPPRGLGTVAVISQAAGSQLLDSWHTTAATNPGGEGDILHLGGGNEFIGRYAGISVYQSDKVPNESTGASGMMTEAGFQASAYGLVMPEMPHVRPSRGDEAEARAVTFYVLRAMYGTGLTNPRRGLELLTQR